MVLTRAQSAENNSNIDSESENLNMPTDGTASNGSQVGASIASFQQPNINPPGPLVIDKDVCDNWKLWKQMWQNYIIITHIDKQTEDYQVALLLHSLGTEALRIYNGMKFESGENAKKTSDIILKFDKHFLGESKEFFERFQFNRRCQESGESIEQYLSELRNKARTCGFCDCMRDKLIMDRFLLGISDDRIRERLISTNDLTLSKAVDISRAMEAASQQIKVMKPDVTEIHGIKRQKKTWGQKEKSDQHLRQNFKSRPPTSVEKTCRYCNRKHRMKKEECYAWGKTCRSCGVRNHFENSVVCKGAGVKAVHTEDHDDSLSSSDGSISSVIVHELKSSDDSRDKPLFCEMKVNKKVVKLQIDCGATVNILPRRYVMNLQLRDEAVDLKMWNKAITRALGKCKVKVKNPVTKQKYNIDFVIVKEDLTPLLSRKAAEKMNLITVNYEKFANVSCLQGHKMLEEEFSDVFSTTPGTLPGEDVHLTVVADADPAIRPARSIPEALKLEVKDTLDRLVTSESIIPVDEPSDWVNQMSVSKKKNGSIRICIDPRPLNLALKREHYPLPLMDDILPQLSNACKFSVCDLKDGYLHCKLDKESSKLTTFATPFGRYRWCRLPFGLKVSSEIFQKRLHQALEGLTGVFCVADDIIVWGNTDAEHDLNLRELLKRCQSVGIRLNLDKCRFGVPEIPFMGHIISSDGLKVDPSKVKAIVDMNAPSDKDGIDRLRGMVNYLSRFMPRLSAVMQPINILSHKDALWSWGPEQDQAFCEVKRLITEAPVLAYFDPNLPLTIQCDASGSSLGAALLQEGRPLAYASRTLSEVETRYATIEKEMLAIIFSVERWHQFTYGRQVTIHTDHQPLVSIHQKALDRAPKRLQGMLLRAAAYDLEVKYLPGKQMHLADMLSRASVQSAVEENGHLEFATVNAIEYLTLPEQRLQEIIKYTREDEALQKLKDVILTGWPKSKSNLHPFAAPYFDFRDELTVADGLIFRGERLVVPKKLRHSIKSDIHIGHSGVESSLRRAREYVYWPGMNSEIKQMIQMCETCRSYDMAQPKESLISHELPSRQWEKIGIDLFKQGEKDFLITVCYFSNFWEIDRLPDTKAKTVIRKVKGQCARYGIPSLIISDNGPQFRAEEFQKFTSQWGIKHDTTSPYHSQSNGKVESAVKTAKKMLARTDRTGEDQFLALLNIRNTPTQGVDSSPAQRMMNRRTRTILPTTNKLLEPRPAQTKHEFEQLELNQKRQAKYYNEHAHDLPVLKPGDTVRMRPTQGKTWQEGTITKGVGKRSYEVTSSDSGMNYRRNRRDLRKTHTKANHSSDAREEEVKTRYGRIIKRPTRL
jgi:hypothetical protein